MNCCSGTFSMQNWGVSLPQACQALQAGKLLIYPTETFYALGCNAFDLTALKSVFQAKRRSFSMPLPLVIGAPEHIHLVARSVSPLACRLIHSFWPGPLSILFPAAEILSQLVCGEMRQVAVRCSSHPAVAQLCALGKMVLTASSANLSKMPSPARLENIPGALLEHTAGVYHVPPLPAGGLPSTIVEIIQDKGHEGKVRIVRSGAVSAELISAQGFFVLPNQDEIH